MSIGFIEIVVNFTFFQFFFLKMFIFGGRSLGRRKLDYTVFDGQTRVAENKVLFSAAMVVTVENQLFLAACMWPLKIKAYFRLFFWARNHRKQLAKALFSEVSGHRKWLIVVVDSLNYMPLGKYVDQACLVNPSKLQ